MRLLIKFSPREEFSYDDVDKHMIQSVIYSLLRNTKYESIHNIKKFKFFTFSDIFPPTDFKPNENKNLLISSPDSDFIKSIGDNLKENPILRFGNHIIDIQEHKMVNPRLKNRFISSSPLVLYKNSRKNIYFSFKRDNDLSFFLERLKDNALKKYNAFYSTNYELKENIFDRIKLRKEAVVKIRKGSKEFIIIGSVWKLLEKFDISKNRKFYKFIMDCGLGEKNSLGFGFVNPVR
ncbi:MAG TPA: CRISPR-associated endoribonuclease Cas6 [Candidatus Altiarchaeales archaeon]|nr:CRISPR-associated endoribonuclease Cas6 [Candidatus Altiarchaeales archaeon]